MKPADKKVENMLFDLKYQTRPELDVKILSECFNELDDFKAKAVPKPRLLKLFIQSKTTKIAAALIIGLGLSMLIYSKKAAHDQFVINQTLEALKSVQTVRMPVNNGNAQLLMLINKQNGRADYIRMDSKDTGDVTITIPGQTYTYNKEKNEVAFLAKEVLYNSTNFNDLVNSVIYASNAKGSRVDISEGFDDMAAKTVVSVNIIRENETLAGRLLIDPQTKLPIYLATDVRGQLKYFGPIEYNVDYPESAFAFIVPDGAKVTDQRPAQAEIQKPKQAELGPIDPVRPK